MNSLTIFKSGNPRHWRQRQHGVTLIELMVGITIGLLTIAVAMGALMVSRGVSGTVTDASQMQQQAAYAFRVLGQQLRQAGSMQLDLAVNKGAGEAIFAEDMVAFTPNPKIYSANFNVAPEIPAVLGNDNPAKNEYKLSLAYQNYQEENFPAGVNLSFFRDCLGAGGNPTKANPAIPPIIQSQFVLDNVEKELHCAGSIGSQQPIIKNVADFQVRYLIQSSDTATAGLPTIQYVNAAGVPDYAGISGPKDWGTVFGVEVCLVLYGDERVDMLGNSTYTGCDVDVDGKRIDVNMGNLPADRKNRLHMAFRSVYQLRSQGRTG